MRLFFDRLTFQRRFFIIIIIAQWYSLDFQKIHKKPSTNFVAGMPMTHCDSKCMSADRKTAGWGITGRQRQWQLLFLHHTLELKKAVGLPASCLNNWLGRHVCITVLSRAIVVLYLCFVISQCRSRYFSLTPWHWNDTIIKDYKENSVSFKVFLGAINTALKT